MTETEKRISAALFAFLATDETVAVITTGISDAHAVDAFANLCDRIAVWIADGGAMRAAVNIQD